MSFSNHVGEDAYSEITKLFDPDKFKYDIKKELLDYFSNKDYCTIYDCSDEMPIGRCNINLKIKIKNYPIGLSLVIDGYGLELSKSLNIRTTMYGSNTPIAYSTYHINDENYLEKLDEYIKDIRDGYNKYKEFIQDISNHYDYNPSVINTLVDLNQYYLYLQFTGHTRVVITPSFEIENGKIITIAYIGKDNSHYPSKIYVNSANMEDVYNTVEFFL